MKRLYKKSDANNQDTTVPQDNQTNNNQIDNTQVSNNQEKTDKDISAKNVVMDLLERIDKSANDIKDAYYSLLDNLNALNNSYPNVYTELKYMVKFPDNSEIKDVAELQQNTNDAINKLSNSDVVKNAK